MPVEVPVEKVRQQAVRVLTAWGMPADLAGITAGALVEADVSGVDSHGVGLLPDYERAVQAGGIDLAARPCVVREGPAVALIDAGAGFGHPAAEFGMRTAIGRARTNGVGIAAVRNSHHFGAAGHYASMAVERGMVGMVTSSANEMCGVPTRGSQARLPTNPIAFAAPAGHNPPFLLDMATTTVAANKVRVHHLTGSPVPPGWVVDGAGNSVEDSGSAREHIHQRAEGGLTMLGGTAEMSSHKGYGLGVMAHLLAATLCGGSFPAADPAVPGRPDNIGHFLMAVDPTAFRPAGAFESDVDRAVDALHRTPAAGPEPVLVAGDPQAAAREHRERHGIPMPPALLGQLKGICGRAGVDYLLES